MLIVSAVYFGGPAFKCSENFLFLFHTIQHGPGSTIMKITEQMLRDFLSYKMLWMVVFDIYVLPTGC